MPTNAEAATAIPTSVQPSTSTARKLWNKVPEITVWFWVIKVLCTTVGETVSDFINAGPADGGQLGLGIPTTFAITGSLLLVAVVVQFRSDRYHPTRYWITVVLMSIVGTLVTDWLHDEKGVSLVTTTIIFSVLLAVVFAIWYAQEKTLSIHSVYKGRREAYYWLVVLVTFALGTSGGDLLSEKVDLGYLNSVLIIVAAVALIAIARFAFKANAVLTFWLAYILTRPLGGNTGDWLSQSDSDGLGLGTTTTSLIFLTIIAVIVAYLTYTHEDVIEEQEVLHPGRHHDG
ncbi:MAG: hypothetical protein WCK97_09670 [Actinomycetes bacterium]